MPGGERTRGMAGGGGTWWGPRVSQEGLGEDLGGNREGSRGNGERTLGIYGGSESMIKRDCNAWKSL